MSEFDLDDVLAGAIDDYRAETQLQISRPGVTAAHATVKHRQRVRAAAMSVLALVAVAVPVTAYAANDHDHNGPPNVAASQSASTVSPTISPPVVSASPTVTARPSSGTVLVANSRTKKIVNAAINLPVWPGFSQWCPAGVTHFTNGKATASRSNQTNYVLGYEGADAASASPVIYANLDGQSADEALLTVHCYGEGSIHPAELLAVRLMPNGTVRTLGYVVTTPDHKIFDYDALTVRMAGRTVEVEVSGDETSDGGPYDAKQLRGYRYANGSFTQVSGPATFPPAPANIAGLDLRNTTIEFPLAICGSGCTSYQATRLVNGVGTERYVLRHGTSNVLYSITYQIEQVVPDGANTTLVRVAQTGDGAPSPAAVYQVSYGHGDRFEAVAGQVTAVGQDDITNIVSVAAVGSGVQVIVDTASGQRIYTYVQKATGTWRRKS